tara:strand:- start:362 stop:694 length:333 start_codon:yes stop_codon:yes gene_type:complete
MEEKVLTNRIGRYIIALVAFGVVMFGVYTFFLNDETKLFVRTPLVGEIYKSRPWDRGSPFPDKFTVYLKVEEVRDGFVKYRIMKSPDDAKIVYGSSNVRTFCHANQLYGI